MPKVDFKKLKTLKEFKRSPALALIKFTERLEQQVNSWVKSALESQLEALNLKINTQIDQKVKENILKGIEKIKGEKGDSIKGEKGDSITGERGLEGKSIKGEKGEKPIAGIDYPIPQNGKDGKSIKGKDGKDGKTIKGENGKDGSPDTPNEIKDKLLMLKTPWIEKDMIKGLGLEMGNLKRTLHRGGMKMYVAYLLGTGDGTTTEFTLPSSPYDKAQMKANVAGGDLFPTDDFTTSGRIITFLTAPRNKAKVRITFQGT